MSQPHKVTWSREAIDMGADAHGWKVFEPSETTDLSCLCGWTSRVPNEETQAAIEDHEENPRDVPFHAESR